MRAAPVTLARPVVVLGGYRTPWLTGERLAARIASLTSGRRGDFLAVAYASSHSVEDAAARAKRAIERWQDARGANGASAAFDRGFDVVGVSMGGIVGRLLAAGGVPVRRLFTLGTPHRGALMAGRVAPDPAARAMRRGSALLASLDGALAGGALEIVPYARVYDGMVGATNAAPVGMHPLWRRGPRWLAHLTITRDDAFTLDIARRLRGEAPIATPGGPAPRD